MLPVSLRNGISIIHSLPRRWARWFLRGFGISGVKFPSFSAHPPRPLRLCGELVFEVAPVCTQPASFAHSVLYLGHVRILALRTVIALLPSIALLGQDAQSVPQKIAALEQQVQKALQE